MYHWFPCVSVFCLVLSYDVLVNMHFQALAITCMALHYHSQVGRTTFHELMIISAAFGGYIVILVGILTGIFTGQPVNIRIVRTFIGSWFHCQFVLRREKVRHLESVGLPCEMYFMYPEHTGDHFQALLKLCSYFPCIYFTYIKGKVFPLQARCGPEGG